MFELCDIKACIEDLDEVMDLIYEEWGRYFRSSKESKISKIKDAVLSDCSFPKIYVLKKNNALIGSFTIKEKDLENCDLSPWLACVVIKKEYRGKGYANKLLDCVKEIIDANYKKMYLVTQLNCFYEKIGFEFVEYVDHNGEVDKLYEYNCK